MKNIIIANDDGKMRIEKDDREEGSKRDDDII